MPKVSLSGMTVDALMDLRRRVDEMLLERRAEIEKQLERMDSPPFLVCVSRETDLRGGSIQAATVSKPTRC